MDKKTDWILPQDLPFQIDAAKWGVLHGAMLLCPGLYLVSVESGDCYVVFKEEADLIFSSEALAYGSDEGTFFFFKTHDGAVGDMVIRYEIERYLALQGRPVSEFDEFYTTALYGAEEAPAYFGTPAPPVWTPHGRMTRYLTLDMGLFLLETDQCVQLMAASYPLWCSELTMAAHERGEMTEYDREKGINRTMGYLFFPKEAWAVPLYELSQTKERKRLKRWITSQGAVQAAVWKYCPEFAGECSEYIPLTLKSPQLLRWLAEALDLDAAELRRAPERVLPYIERLPEIEVLQLPDSWRLPKAAAVRSGK